MNGQEPDRVVNQTLFSLFNLNITPIDRHSASNIFSNFLDNYAYLSDGCFCYHFTMTYNVLKRKIYHKL